MIVKELIKLLEAQPQGSKVVTSASDSSVFKTYNEVNKAKLIPVVQDCTCPGCKGAYREPDERNTGKKMMVVRLW